MKISNFTSSADLAAAIRETKHDTLLTWLQQNKNLLNLSQIEKEAGLAAKTVRFYVAGERGLKPEARQALLAVLTQMRKDYPTT